MTGEHEQRWFQAMCRGVEAHGDLLSVLVPRVAPEYAVVAAAAWGLSEAIGEEPWDVYLEHPIEGRAGAKCDIVVKPRHPGEAKPAYFEWKALWAPGFKECIDGLRRDREKLTGLPSAYAVTFLYVVNEAPIGFEGRCHSQPVLTTLERARQQLGDPVYTGNPFLIRGRQVRGEALVVAWRS